MVSTAHRPQTGSHVAARQRAVRRTVAQAEALHTEQARESDLPPLVIARAPEPIPEPASDLNALENWDYDPVRGQYINHVTGEVNAILPVEGKGGNVAEQSTPFVPDEPDTAPEEPGEPPWEIPSEMKGRGVRWTVQEIPDDSTLNLASAGQPIPCPSCGARLVLYPHEGKWLHVCEWQLRSEEPKCEYFKAVKKATDPDTSAGKKGGKSGK